MISDSSDWLFMTLITRNPSMHKSVLMCLVLPSALGIWTKVLEQSCIVNAAHSNFLVNSPCHLLLFHRRPLWARAVHNRAVCEGALPPARQPIRDLRGSSLL